MTDAPHWLIGAGILPCGKQPRKPSRTPGSTPKENRFPPDRPMHAPPLLLPLGSALEANKAGRGFAQKEERR